MSSTLCTLNKNLDQMNVSPTKLATLANASTPVGTATATTTVAGTVKQAAADADSAVTIPAAAPAGGTGTAAGGWDTAGNRDLAIATINGLRTAVTDLQTNYNDLLAKLRTAGVVAP